MNMSGRRRALPLPLCRTRLQSIVGRFPGLRLGVVGDYFLDAYFECDPRLQETSLETGKVCHQVVRTRRQPGAAGTVATNLKALGVGSVEAVGFCGEDGEGFELRRAMERGGIAMNCFLAVSDRVTPTYGKPCAVRSVSGKREWAVIEEMNRLDIKNRRPTPVALQQRLMDFVLHGLNRWDGMIVVDQVSEPNCGVITSRVRRFLGTQARLHPDFVTLADSRERIGEFRCLALKPSQREAANAMAATSRRLSLRSAREHAQALSRRARRPVFLTLAERGMLIADGSDVQEARGFPVTGPTDPAGAGDSTSAALLASRACGATLTEAAFIANLAGSITVQQVGTTGTASPVQLLKRFDEVSRPNAA